MALQDYVSLGRSGLKVSPFCLGTMTFGTDWGWGSEVAEATQILDRYIELGGNFIDTANVYTYGHSEKIIGDHIGRYPAKRNQMVIATKFFANMFTGNPNGGGASRKSIIAACEHSLRRLQTDYIDLYWLHCYDKHTPIEETMRALDDLVKDGKVRYIGFSDTPAWKTAQAQMIAQMRGWSPLIALQLEYNLLERTIEGEHVPLALEMGLGITPWSPLKNGVLSGKYTRANHGQIKAARGAWTEANLTEKAYTIVDELIHIAKQHSTTPAAVALNWVHNRPGVTSTIIGAKTLDQLEANLAAFEFTLVADQKAKLDELSKPQLNFPADFVQNAGPFGYSGTTVNGETYAVFSLSPPTDEHRY